MHAARRFARLCEVISQSREFTMSHSINTLTSSTWTSCPKCNCTAQILHKCLILCVLQYCFYCCFMCVRVHCCRSHAPTYPDQTYKSATYRHHLLQHKLQFSYDVAKHWDPFQLHFCFAFDFQTKMHFSFALSFSNYRDRVYVAINTHTHHSSGNDENLLINSFVCFDYNWAFAL